MDERREIRKKFVANKVDADAWLAQKDAEDLKKSARSWANLLMLEEKDGKQVWTTEKITALLEATRDE